MNLCYRSLETGKTNIQAHSHSIDDQLGFNVKSIERELLERAFKLDPEGSMGTWGRMLHEGAQTWVGLAPETLLTPYDELFRMCEKLQIGENGHLVDLGAAYGRMGFVLNEFRPSAFFTGIECVSERVNEGNRIFAQHKLDRARLIHDNLFRPDFTLPVGDAYLIYDYGNIEHIRWTMGQLQNLAGIHRFQVIARGDGIRSLIQYAHPWLADMGEPHHDENFSVYANYEL